MIPLNQPQKTGLSGLEPVTLIVASSSIPWPHSYQKKSLWWPMWGQSARYSMGLRFIFKRNTPQLAAAGIKGMRIQFRLRSAWPGSNFMRQRLGCPAACGVGALPPFHSV